MALVDQLRQQLRVLPQRAVDPGSAVGVRFCQEEDHLAAELATGEALLVEQFISGRESTVGVLEPEAGVTALPVLEVRTPGRLVRL